MAVIIQTVAQMKHPVLLHSQASKRLFHLLFKQLMTDTISRIRHRLVFDEVPKVVPLFLIHWGLQALRLLAVHDYLTHLLGRYCHLFTNLFGRRFAPQLLQQASVDTNETANFLDHIYRKTNDAHLVGNGTSNSLANPPGRTGTKLVAPGSVKFLRSMYEPNVPLLNQV